ncbi:MAG: hypothetical protein ACPGOY_13880 [Rhodospirillaceae bacterium]
MSADVVTLRAAEVTLREPSGQDLLDAGLHDFNDPQAVGRLAEALCDGDADKLSRLTPARALAMAKGLHAQTVGDGARASVVHQHIVTLAIQFGMTPWEVAAMPAKEIFAYSSALREMRERKENEK